MNKFLKKLPSEYQLSSPSLLFLEVKSSPSSPPLFLKWAQDDQISPPSLAAINEPRRRRQSKCTQTRSRMTHLGGSSDIKRPHFRKPGVESAVQVLPTCSKRALQSNRIME